MRGTFFSRLRAGASKLHRDQRGNAMMLTAAAIVPILGLVGSGIDIGRAYMAQLRLQQACDAGVLAGRRAMAGSTYTSSAKGEATKMFNFNYPSSYYGSSRVAFDSQASGTSSVAGTASAYLPTMIMKIFKQDGFDLAVSCTAKLEISNADIMMVLDVTGSMDTVNSGDSVSRIEALKTAATDFFDTLTTADLGDGRLRFGVVPYSGTVNVGRILYDGDPDWISDTADTPSRTPHLKKVYNGGSTTYGTATNGSYDYGGWGNSTNISSTQANCSSPPQSAGTSPSKSGNAYTSNSHTYIDGNDNQVTTSTLNQDYSYKEYQYQWTGGRNAKCQRTQRTVTYTQKTPSTLTEPPQWVFDFFRYENRALDVSGGKNGGTLTFNTGTKGVDESWTWGGCIIERHTEPFGPTSTAPSDAYDMDIDMVPTSDDDTKWKMFLPDFAYSRGSIDPSDSYSTKNVNSFGDNASGGSDIGACPPAAMKLTTMTKDDRSSFVSYIDSLHAQGYTYHDAGMVWGARLLSPDGLFASENATAPNNRPISRHIIFMTDGEPTAPRSNFSFQSQEQSTGRIGASSDNDAVDRHVNRFLQLCEAAKAKNITIWVVGFGTSLTTPLNTCATPGKAYKADNAAELNENFQAIARQISKLRLSQ